MAAAVANAGGLGSIPCAMLTPEGISQEIQHFKNAVNNKNAALNLNFFCHQTPLPRPNELEAWQATLAPYYTELGIDPTSVIAGAGRAPFSLAQLQLVQTFRPSVVSFHFGLPETSLLQSVKATGAFVMSSATTVQEALWLEANGADVVIAQGLEAGGHRGLFLTDDLSTQLTTLTLVPQILQAIQVPLIASGGIADAIGVKAMLMMGASAVQVGTSYLLCHEATTSVVHRKALVSIGAETTDARHTALTNLFTGRPARGIVNRAMRELGAINATAPRFPLATAAIAPLRSAAESRGLGDFSPLWSGQNTHGCEAIGAEQMTLRLAGL